MDIKIKYSSPATGYVEEILSASTPQGCINLLKARVPEGLQINGMTYLPTPQPSDPRDGSGSRR